MKTLFTVSIFFLTSVVFAQKWRNIDQSYLNIKYKLAPGWTLDGFGSDFGYWDNGGSSVCDCAGTINLDDEHKLGMVIYPTDPTTDAKRREYVWDYHFIPSGNKQSLPTKKLTFDKEISTWELTAGSDEYMGMLNDVVWKLTTGTPTYGLIIYIWGDAANLQAQESVLLKMLDTFTLVKK